MFKKNWKVEDVVIASPCPVSWSTMAGDERIRFCSICHLNVYNLSEMDKREIEELLAGAEGKRVCMRMFRRKDGTFLTKNCPIGKKLVDRAQQRLRFVAAWVCGFLGLSPTVATATPDERATDLSHPAASAKDIGKRSPPLAHKRYPVLRGSAKESDPLAATNKSSCSTPNAVGPQLNLSLKGRVEFSSVMANTSGIDEPALPDAVRPSSLLPWIPATPINDIDIGGSAICLPKNESRFTVPAFLGNRVTALTSFSHTVETADNRALACFDNATKMESAKNFPAALASYASALDLIRVERTKYDIEFTRRIARRYARLMRRTKNSAGAKVIEHEFGLNK